MRVVREIARLKNALIGLLLGLISRLWLRTLTLDLMIDDGFDANEKRPLVLAFFHGTQFSLLTWRRRRSTAVMVSHSSDGEIQARALRINGLTIVRGSSSRGGARGLAALIRKMKNGSDCAFAVDGPRGPYGVAKSGAVFAAERAGGVIVPLGSAIARGWVLEKTWDKFSIPQPFSRVIVMIGAPLDATSTTTQDLERAIRDVNERACAELALRSSQQMQSRRSRRARPSASL